MSVTCDVGHECKVECEGDCCIAVYFPETDGCIAVCCDDDIASIKSKFSIRAKPEQKVDLCIKGATLSTIRMILDAMLSAE